MENNIYQELKQIQKESVETKIQISRLDNSIEGVFVRIENLIETIKNVVEEQKNLTAKHMKVVEDNIALKADNNWFKSLSTKIFVSMGSIATICLSAYLFLYHKIDDLDKTYHYEISTLQQHVAVTENIINEKNIQKNK